MPSDPPDTGLQAPVADSPGRATQLRGANGPGVDGPGRANGPAAAEDRPAAGAGAPLAARAATADRPIIRQSFPGEALAVRAALADTVAALAPYMASEHDCGTVEIVLAEVLNNIVEHAYRSGPGLIEMQLRLGPGCLEVFVADEGHPLPGGILPLGSEPQTGDIASLPEGGFGWALIRKLSHDLTYRREGERNQLSFRLSLEQSTAIR
jgi:serine/threonine-protein kinase RsbW